MGGLEVRADLKTARPPRIDALVARNNYIAIAVLMGDESTYSISRQYGITRERVTQIVKDFCHHNNPSLSLALQQRPGYGVKMLREYHRDFVTAEDALWYDQVREARGYKIEKPTIKKTTHKFWQR